MEDVRQELEPEQISSLYSFALELSAEMRALIQSIVSKGFETETKADKSVVTTADFEAEKLVRNRIQELYPEHGVLGEEFGLERAAADFRWVVDPVDGTAEFATGLPLYGSILGLYYKGAPLIGVIDHPAIDQRISAGWKLGAFVNGEPLTLSEGEPLTDSSRIGITAPANFLRYGDELAIFQKIVREYPVLRIYHSCSMHTATAIGSFEAAIEWNVKPWDFAATQIIIEEAGGEYREVKNQEGLESVPVLSAIFGTKTAVETICQSLKL